MKCAIHQPQFLPWLGYLHKIHNVDKFIFLDNVQFKKNEFQNRNRIIAAGETRWLTVPVSFNFGDTLRETKIAANDTWRKKMMHTLALNYAKTPCFRQFREGLAEVIEQEWKSIAELNEATIRWLMKCFDIRTEVYIASQLPELSTDSTQRLIEICRQVGADTYLSGAGGHDYLKPAEFEKAGIKLKFQQFEHPVYPQFHSSRLKVQSSQFTVQSSPSFAQMATEDKQFTEEDSGFVPCLSAVDGLFNCGGGAAGRKMLNIETE